MTAEPLDELVAALAADAKPVKRLHPVPHRLAGWLALALAIVASGVLVLGVRRNLPAAIGDPTFWLRAGVTFLAGVLAAAAALVVSIPGAERGARHRLLALGTAAAWIALLAGSFVMRGATLARLSRGFETHCGLNIVELALVPAIVLYLMVRRGTPLDRGWAGSLAALAGACLGAVGVQFVCPVNGAAHLLMSHALPVVVAAIVGIALGAVAFAPLTSTLALPAAPRRALRQ